MSREATDTQLKSLKQIDGGGYWFDREVFKLAYQTNRKQKRVHLNTYYSLVRRGWVEQGPFKYVQLTEAGKALLEAPDGS